MPITEDLLDAIAQVESGNDPFAVGDRHLRSPAFGAFQMRRPALLDVQRRRGIHQDVQPEDLVGNAALQRELAKAYLDILEHDYGLSTLEQLLSGYHAGPTATRRGSVPESTQTYIQRVLDLLGE